MSTAQRQEVVTVARSFLATRYHHHGQVKGVGVDCATFLALVYREAGVVPPVDVQHYSVQWHLHHKDPLYENAIRASGGREADIVDIGDIALYFQGRQFAHGAIVTATSPLRIIHAYAPSRSVVEGDECEFGIIASARKKFFSPW